MIKEMEKALKRYLKGKNRITMGVVVAFLLGSSFSYGDVTIKYEDSTIKILDNSGTITEIGTVTKNSADEFIWTIPEGTNITETVKIDDTVNTNSIKVNIVNNGNISGSSNGGDNSGNGIYSYSDTSNSIVGNIINNGSISGSSNGGDNSGNGIYSYSDTSNSIIGNIINNGSISGSISGYGYYSGNGICLLGPSSSTTTGNIINYGTISGSETNNGRSYVGIGILVYSEIGFTKVGDIRNYGTISGTLGNGIFSFSEGLVTIGAITNSGIISSVSENGIYSASNAESSNIGYIVNSGVIMGKNNGIYIYGDSNSGIANYNNHGLVIGQTPVKIEGSGTPINNPEGQGMAVTLDGSGNISSIARGNGTGVSAEGYSIINATSQNSGVDAYNEYTNDENISNSIINGAGVNSGTVTIEADKNFSLNDGIINAYKTAVTVKDGASFTGTDVTINGGGLDRTTPVISGDSGANTVNISGNSFINGKVDLGDGDDILSIGNSTQINGDIDGGTGTDTLDFGSAIARAVGNDNINLFHKISNVEEININQKVTAFETSEITGAKNINIGKNGELVLRIDGANSNKHALSNGNSSGTIDSDGGKLLLALNGVSDGSTIDMGMNLGDGIYGVENPDIEYRDLFTLDTTSYLHSIRKTPGSSTITVETKSTLPLSPTTPEYTNYEKLNKIYQSMRVVDGVKEFNVDTDEKLSSFMGYLNDIYAGNPYSYSSELSRKSMGMFRDIAVENQFKADTGKWMIYGGLTHIDGGTKDTYYGKGYYTYDIGSSDIDSDTKITGAYMLGEYGVSDDFKAGVVVGGNKLKSDLSNDSKVDGDALYIGGYAKKYLGNLKVTAGAGFQYGDYDADRLAINNVASDKAEPVMKYSDNYNDISYDIYLNGRYSHNIGDNLYLEPYGTLSYTYVKQDGADEGNKTLAIETDSQSFDYTSAKVGLDLKKVIPHEKGKSTLSVGASYTRLLNGADEEYITGRFKGGSDFDILVAHKNEHSLGLNAKYTLELENGILFDVKGSYAVERDSHNQSGKNKTKGEWIVGAGVGYKF
ncbi:autotransporter [Fusobacterium varium]|nr:autotransporter [Fusobacterium varium]